MIFDLDNIGGVTHAPDIAKFRSLCVRRVLFTQRSSDLLACSGALRTLMNPEILHAHIPWTAEELASEIWRPIPDFIDIYSASNIGRIKSHRRPRFGKLGFLSERLLKIKNNSNGYPTVRIWRDCVGKSWTVHRLVLLAFVPNPSNLPWINHIDGNPMNNRLENLEWCSMSRNAQHAYDIGLKQKMLGSSNGRAKLTEEDVRAIRGLAGKATQVELGKIYGVSQAQIGLIIRRDFWKHVL